jgi:ABC-type glutathione transport system ATPase component
VSSALILRELTKRFNTTVAIDEISLAVEPGEFVALLGPSGSGLRASNFQPRARSLSPEATCPGSRQVSAILAWSFSIMRSFRI